MTPTPPDKQESRDKELAEKMQQFKSPHSLYGPTVDHRIQVISEHLSTERTLHQQEVEGLNNQIETLQHECGKRNQTILTLRADIATMRGALNELREEIDLDQITQYDDGESTTGDIIDRALSTSPGTPLLDRIKQLEVIRDEVEKDKTRLEWLVKATLDRSGDHWIVAEFIAPVAYGPTIREAIDAAIQTSKGNGGGQDSGAGGGTTSGIPKLS